jgi:HAE1 family hydrophobic/amphiphilic exporter-1
VLFSFVVSMTLTAVLCSKFMTNPADRKKTWFQKALLSPFDRWLTGLELGYEKLIKWMLEHRFANMARIMVTVVVGFGFYYFIGSEMMPLADVGQASVQMEMKPGTSFAGTQKAVNQLEDIILEEGGSQGWIEHAAIEIGEERGPGMPQRISYSGYGMRMVNGVSGMLTLTEDRQARYRTAILELGDVEACDPGGRQHRQSGCAWAEPCGDCGAGLLRPQRRSDAGVLPSAEQAPGLDPRAL